jgi:3-isopropylmalate/(R)-2-methylmalate dehydratase small subunit
MGLLIFELPQANEIKKDDIISIDLDNGTITNTTQQKEYRFTPIPDFMQELIDVGGLINYAKKEIGV